jgi:hypothetical protein
MNSADTLRQIHRFLKGKYRKEVDAFCIYQWVDRCYFHGWWDLGVKLVSSIPPNSLNQEYHKRLEYLLSECRSKLKDQFIELKSPKAAKLFSVPKSFWDVCNGLDIRPGGSSNSRLRLNYSWAKVILIEKIKPDRCIFYFSDMDRNKLIDWLDRNRFEHLKANVRPKTENSRQRARLRITWDDATNLIPNLCEDAKKIVSLIETIQKGSPEAIEEIKKLVGIT